MVYPNFLQTIVTVNQNRNLILLFFLFFHLILPFAYASNTSGSSSWTADETMTIYFEAISKISEKAIESIEVKNIATESLKLYLRNSDPYSDYLSPEEYKEFKESQKMNYVGLGMDIERDESRGIICFPYPGGPADRYGVKSGDILEEIDGLIVTDKSVFAIGSLLRGEEGTDISISIRKKTGTIKSIRVKRASVRSESVTKKVMDGITVIQLLFFTASTQRDLKYTLMNLKDSKPVVIDLRGNPGGDLNSAIDSVMLFLENDSRIVDIIKRDETKSYKNLTPAENNDSPLYLWQDETTASAAEVFIAALTQNKRAVSIGKKSFGKGTTQDIIELSDGSAMFLTTGFLQTPDGTRYHGKGLLPDYPIDAENPRTNDYLMQVKTVNKSEDTDKKNSGKTEKAAKEQHSSDSNNNVSKILVSVDPTDNYFACFDKDFLTEEDAKIWAREIQNSLNNTEEIYLLQRMEAASAKFIVCLGPYKSKVNADTDIQRITKLTGRSLFLTAMEENSKKDSKSIISGEYTVQVKPAEKKSNDISNKKEISKVTKYFIRAVSYSNKENAQTAQYILSEKLRNSGIKGKVSILERTRNNNQKYYIIVIGPYEEKNDSLLIELKDKGIVANDSLWIQYRAE